MLSSMRQKCLGMAVLTLADNNYFEENFAKWTMISNFTNNKYRPSSLPANFLFANSLIHIGKNGHNDNFEAQSPLYLQILQKGVAKLLNWELF